MVKKVFIDKKEFTVNDNEFVRLPHQEYTNLKILDKVGYYERIISLISELTKCIQTVDTFININSTYGGFVDIECSDIFSQLFILNHSEYQQHNENIETNIKTHKKTNINLITQTNFSHFNKNCILFSETSQAFNKETKEFIKSNVPIMIINNNNLHFVYDKYDIYNLSNTNLNIFIPKIYYQSFYDEFKHFIKDDNLLVYDNLLNLCIMVKNGGPQFAEMLKENMQHIDTWTILDTGSTDDTIKIINETLVPFKKGTLYQEPFINFRDSRNRLLDLAGTSAKFQIMLDDTYVVKGNLRAFLNEVRGDQYGSSFTLFIKSDDTEYGSNRIIKSKYELRYIHRIHEVISDKNNINIVVPKDKVLIDDKRFDYMEKRTMERKQLDLKLLYEEVDEDKNDPRAYYYLAQTYNIIGDYEKAFYYFTKRAEFSNSGFVQERVDAIFESARIANFKLNKPWEECEKLYMKCYNADESRPESLYFIGIHYYLETNYEKAFEYFKKAFEIGFPVHCQYSLKPTLSFHFLPKFLCKICYGLKKYELGLKAAELFLKNNAPNADAYEEVVSWYKIYEKLCIKVDNIKPKVPAKPIFCFHADGGFNNWSGSSILTIGVGGSETYIIELARYIQQSGLFDVYVFCNCLEEEIFEGVIYKPLSVYYSFINQNYIHTCIVSRFSEYLPVTFMSWTENVYLVVHDLSPSGIVIPIDNKLKKIFCLTEWHVTYFTQLFPSLQHITVPFYYGIDFEKFHKRNICLKETYKFIYSSFPNRGLLELLQMWPKIYEFQPMASLHIYCDVNGTWVNQVQGAMMEQIRELMQLYNVDQTGMNIYYHGWVNKEILAESWLTADIWFYPCTFMETFCLTALEAALTKTLVITNDLAALQNTVGDRGIVIEGNATEAEWQEKALIEIKKYLTSDPKNINIKNELVEKNYKWASTLSWKLQANKLLEEYILQQKLEYKGMYNWTNDAPYDTKKYFLEAIEYFNKNNQKVLSGQTVKVLEIGTYTGTSLINIIKLIPNSIGYGLDKWSNYIEYNTNNRVELLNSINELEIEASFYKNIQVGGLEGRIKGIKGDSYEKLFQMIKEEQQFDFIYVDGSHLLLDCYTDIILSWKILAKGGLLAIDDYLYVSTENMYQSPLAGVNHFLLKHREEIKILHKGYRVFLIKL
jgi:tetratricopeptide (TPR) repeat protein